MHAVFLSLYRLLYEGAARPFLFRMTPQESHARMMTLLSWLDTHPYFDFLLRWAHNLAFIERPMQVGGVRLTYPLILAAGFVKGEGFDGEPEALASVQRNIIPGWRVMPMLVGAVEFGSFTRHPRLGNPGVVLWRDKATHSTQNRVGLKNPGVMAAAEFLAMRHRDLPRVFGINIAVSPGVTDLEQERCDIQESIAAFLNRGVKPSWFTLNLSCPNTEDDPGSHQTEARAQDLCAAAVQTAGDIPLWVKVSPDLADEQYRALLRAFEQTGVRAVIATNTLAQPAPDGTIAGVGGGQLYQRALAAVRLLSAEKHAQNYAIDVIACGGVADGASRAAFTQADAAALQYWSALIYRGPLAAALIAEEGALQR